MKKGDYVVYLSLNGKKRSSDSQIPTYYVYRLKEDFIDRRFLIEKDLEGSTRNGYTYNDIELRPAFPAEIEAYKLANGPVSIKNIKIEEYYEIY